MLICLHAVTSTLIGPEVGSPLKPLVSAEHQMILLGNGWGSKPTWNGSHIHSRHIKGDWQPSYAFDRDMDPSSCRYHHTCWSWLGRSAGIFGHCLAWNDTAVHSGWVSKPTWNGSYFPSRHIKEDWKSSYAFDGNMDPSSCRYHHTCWTWLERSDGVFGHCWARNDTAIYCGWGSQSTWGMVPTSTQSIKKLIDINILHSVDGGMDLSSWHYLPQRQLLSGLIWEVHWNLWYLLNTKSYCQEMVEALNSHGMICSSTPDI